jgi:hypothetical protein
LETATGELTSLSVRCKARHIVDSKTVILAPESDVANGCHMLCLLCILGAVNFLHAVLMCWFCRASNQDEVHGVQMCQACTHGMYK